MAYVPGHPHDLFLSYAHDEGEWAGAFRARLEKALSIKLGRTVSFWQDIDDLRIGQVWREEIENAIRGTAAFLTICSPTYLNRPFCAKEYQKFVEVCEAIDDPARLRDRLLVIIKTAALDNRHKAFFPELQHVEFFGKAGDEYVADSQDFDTALRNAAAGIAAILLRMRNSKTRVYVAQTAEDMENDRTAVVQQLEKDGYNVTTVEPGLSGLLQGEIEAAERAVFLLGQSFNAYIERQFRTAVDLGRPIVCWIHPVRSATADPKLATLIDGIRTMPGNIDLLGGPSVRAVIQELQQLLKPPPVSETLPAAGKSGKVCLLYDLKTVNDAVAARQVRDLLQKNEMAVYGPDMHRSEDIFQAVRQQLAECDGVLLFRPTSLTPDPWLEQTFPHVQFADHIYRQGREKLRARTFLLADSGALGRIPGLRMGDVDVIPWQGEISSGELEPFFRRMQPRSADAGC
jgi:hypothetical protein